jgi:putative peptide zinc metalloprotease protein
VTVPIIKLIRYLAADPRLERVRKRAVLATVAMVAGVLVILQLIPFPNHFRAPGVVRATERTEMASDVAGELEKVYVQPGTTVVVGQPLLGFKNPELELELKEAEARTQEVEVRLLKAMKDESADLKPLMKSKEAISERVTKLKSDVEKLTVRARHDGVWVAPGIQEFKGRWMQRGSSLGLLVNPASFEFVATVLQEDANSVFARPLTGTEVRLMSDVGAVLEIGEVRVIPGEQRQLPSPALGWRGGGEIPVEMGDERGNKAAEPYFKVIAPLPANAGLPLFDGVSGRIRFDLGSEPLLTGWTRRLKQLLQKRYQL